MYVQERFDACKRFHVMSSFRVTRQIKHVDSIVHSTCQSRHHCATLMDNYLLCMYDHRVTQLLQVAAKAQLSKGSALGGKGLSELVYVLQHDAEPPLLSEGDTMLEVIQPSIHILHSVYVALSCQR
jgi:hypothetical protein